MNEPRVYISEPDPDLGFNPLTYDIALDITEAEESEDITFVIDAALNDVHSLTIARVLFFARRSKSIFPGLVDRQSVRRMEEWVAGAPYHIGPYWTRGGSSNKEAAYLYYRRKNLFEVLGVIG